MATEKFHSLLEMVHIGRECKALMGILCMGGPQSHTTRNTCTLGKCEWDETHI